MSKIYYALKNKIFRNTYNIRKIFNIEILRVLIFIIILGIIVLIGNFTFKYDAKTIVDFNIKRCNMIKILDEYLETVFWAITNILFIIKYKLGIFVIICMFYIYIYTRGVLVLKEFKRYDDYVGEIANFAIVFMTVICFILNPLTSKYYSMISFDFLVTLRVVFIIYTTLKWKERDCYKNNICFIILFGLMTIALYDIEKILVIIMFSLLLLSSFLSILEDNRYDNIVLRFSTIITVFCILLSYNYAIT